jgi:hypothetical protein
MPSLLSICEMTMTGLVILIMGLITLNPEIYFSGVVVMIVSAVMQIKEFQHMQVEVQSPVEAVPMLVPPVEQLFQPVLESTNLTDLHSL